MMFEVEENFNAENKFFEHNILLNIEGEKSNFDVEISKNYSNSDDDIMVIDSDYYEPYPCQAIINEEPQNECENDVNKNANKYCENYD